MGFSGKPQVDSGTLELDAKKWVIAGIPLRAPLKPIFTNPVEKESESSGDECSTTTTPTSEDARIPTRLTCPLAPKKRKATLKCNYNREFFTPPPDLETVFLRHVN